jgi:hypothetical protein
MELLVQSGFLGWNGRHINVGVVNWASLSLVDALDGSVGLEVLGDLSLNLSEVLRDIGVAFFESLFGELSDFSSHHALLVLEKAVGSTEEAVEGDNFLEESELGVGLLLGLLGLGRLDGLLDGLVDLGVDFTSRQGGDAGVKGRGLSRLGQSGLDESSDLLNMSLSIDLGGFDTSLLLNSIDQSNWHSFLGNAHGSTLLSFHC